MKTMNVNGSWSLVGMFVDHCDTKEVPMISFENLVIQQTGNNLTLNFKEVAVGVPVLEGDGGYHFQGRGTIEGHTITWESSFLDAFDRDVLIDFTGKVSKDGNTFMGSGHWIRKDDEEPCHGTLTFAGELAEESW